MSLAVILMASLASAGCPELNQQPEKGTNPLFSVYDPAGRGRVSASAGAATAPTAATRSAMPFVKTQGLPSGDQGPVGNKGPDGNAGPGQSVTAKFYWKPVSVSSPGGFLVFCAE